MERYRLKNIMILILALLNVFLLAALAVRGTEARTVQRVQQQELVSLFAADGVVLDASLIPKETALTGCTLTRDETLEQKAAALLLGERAERTVQGGGICTYTSEGGAAVFRDTGSFDAACSSPAENGEALCAEFCREFSYDTPVFSLDETGSGTATAVRLWEKAPVVNSTVTFTLERGSVTAVSGSLLPLTAAGETGEDMLSAFAALTAFQQMRHESSSVVSTITAIELCYELQSTAASPMVLIPAWHISTDTASFYVNCASGTVRRA